MSEKFLCNALQDPFLRGHRDINIEDNIKGGAWSLRLRAAP